ncbi:DUF4183 domain-containing protein [Paenibacillus sp. alder61]|nr:DUF4183 domain-containing protein [Paenibacillus sp. alder61]
MPEENLHSQITIQANQFTDDEGKTAAAFAGLSESSYTNLFINGVLQEKRLYSISSTALTLDLGSDIILAGTPVIIENVEMKVLIKSG